MIKVVLFGSGNLATHLFRSFKKSSNVDVVQMYARKIASLSNFDVHRTDNLELIENADVYIICVSDDAISNLSGQLKFQNKLVVHTSGSLSVEKLNNKNRKGVFYPLQSFSKNKEVNFLTVPVCVEAQNEEDLKLLKQLAGSISENVYEINSDQRKSLHLAAVFVNNFVNHMYKIGNDICSENKIPFRILDSIIKETAKKITNLAPEEAQTGPARRNDKQTIKRHLSQLKNKNQKKIYKILTKSIQKTYGRKEL
ncbi:Rossmann-like and DUF2520 domain-containing protein [Abyssalbus ytuae]|uniref:DUF2520 domain-containing protein n=1 Tax=Abyssalbus ytuae TaxID=2926907 RepID=A0A9E6ZUY3_9FLAO|nr:DUF2520 domain-containing protein [Abyssalbus ytuae]UOB17251.1 DUF2520 domain-containing protein [Abyssalbus ytuae]